MLISEKKYHQKGKLHKNKIVINLAEKNGMWMGDDIGYNGLHSWVKRRFKKPKLCQCCNNVPPYDMANISGKYKRDLSDWEWLCRKCHMTKDERMKNLLQGHNKRKKKPCQKCGILTTGIKFCIKCSKIRRLEWWCEYNKRPKRKKYRENYYKNIKKPKRQ